LATTCAIFTASFALLPVFPITFLLMQFAGVELTGGILLSHASFIILVLFEHANNNCFTKHFRT
jgi:hypothetical protein